MVGCGANRFARIKSGLVCGGGRDSQIALPYVPTYDLGICCWCGVCSLHFQTHEEIELLVGLIVPEFGRTEMRCLLDQGHMLLIARVGHNETTGERQDAVLLLGLKAVVAVRVVGPSRGH